MSIRTEINKESLRKHARKPLSFLLCSNSVLVSDYSCSRFYSLWLVWSIVALGLETVCCDRISAVRLRNPYGEHRMADDKHLTLWPARLQTGVRQNMDRHCSMRFRIPRHLRKSKSRDLRGNTHWYCCCQHWSSIDSENASKFSRFFKREGGARKNKRRNSILIPRLLVLHLLLLTPACC